MDNRKFNNMSHWMCYTKIYRVYDWVKQRCNNKNTTSFNMYWWRWIKCLWNNFEEFYEDMWENYKEWLQLDRIDNNWNYCKENCRWVTPKNNSRNTRKNIVYKWKCLAEWCEELNLNYKTIYSRLKKWISFEKALK